MFIILKGAAEIVVFLLAQQVAEGGEQDGVLAGRVRAVQAEEGPQRLGQDAALRGALEGRRGRPLADLVRQPPPGLVLGLQHDDQLDELRGLLEAWK